MPQSIEKYREKNQSTIVRRAGSLFQHLTAGSFEGLEVDFSERGEPLLLGVRAGDRTHLTVEAMSEGSRDQLYLALRLASLEIYLDKHEPIPLVIDDLLVHFDDERALAALEALLQLSERTQVIFFTHHQHLLDLVKQHFAGKNIYFHRLEGRGAGRPTVETFR